MSRILSGIKPSGDLHLGNYLGALKPWVKMQHDFACLFCVVDLHSLTVWQDPTNLRRVTREVIAAYLASGIDPKHSLLFVQSHVSAHAELAWILSCVARMGWMSRMTQFKEKTGKDKENVSLGLFAYPALMAADILLYKTTHVPVGEDQKQHVELARDIAQKFNHDFGRDIFAIPEPVIQKTGARIMSLRDGTKKMSKSDGNSEYGCIYLSDSADQIALKFQKAKTDSEALPTEVAGLEGRPEAHNLVQIYAALLDISVAETLRQVGGKNFATFKGILTDLTVSTITPLGQEMKRFMAETAHLDQILAEGAHRATVLAQPVLESVYDAVGFVKKKAL